MIVKKVAFLSMDEESGEFGHFVLSDGTKSPYFASKAEAYYELGKFIAQGRLSREEYQHLSTEINRQSQLVREMRDVDPFVDLEVSTRNLNEGKTELLSKHLM